MGVMASAGLTRSDVNVQAAGPVGVWKLVAQGKSHGMAGVPDWIPPIEQAGVKIRIMPSDNFFPTMAQAIGSSDKIIAERSGMVRRFVRASLRGMKDIMDDPAEAAKAFVAAVPSWKGKTGYIEAVFRYYAKLVYPGQSVLGEIDGDRLGKLQDFYLKSGIIRKSTPVADLYTNRFIK
jgi:NitT/TauT family transport system substrate-binding protein